MSETNSSETTPSLAENQKSERQAGSYILEQKLGEGGMAEVWKARHQVLGTYVAIKFLSAGYAGTPDIEQRFLGKERSRPDYSIPISFPPTTLFTRTGAVISS